MDSVRYLHSLGHTKIGYIGTDEARYHGYMAALKELGLPENKNNIINDAILSMEGGYFGMLELLDRNSTVTAVFCSNDMVSIGALRACKERRIDVPNDISLFGINDIENTQYTTPMLSSIHVPLDEMGRMVVSILLNRIEGSHTSHVKILFPYRIVRRESCKKIN